MRSMAFAFHLSAVPVERFFDPERVGTTSALEVRAHYGMVARALWLPRRRVPSDALPSRVMTSLVVARDR